MTERLSAAEMQELAADGAFQEAEHSAARACLTCGDPLPASKGPWCSYECAAHPVRRG